MDLDLARLVHGTSQKMGSKRLQNGGKNVHIFNLVNLSPIFQSKEIEG